MFILATQLSANDVPATDKSPDMEKKAPKLPQVDFSVPVLRKSKVLLDKVSKQVTCWCLVLYQILFICSLNSLLFKNLKQYKELVLMFCMKNNA